MMTNNEYDVEAANHQLVAAPLPGPVNRNDVVAEKDVSFDFKKPLRLSSMEPLPLSSRVKITAPETSKLPLHSSKINKADPPSSTTGIVDALDTVLKMTLLETASNSSTPQEEKETLETSAPKQYEHVEAEHQAAILKKESFREAARKVMNTTRHLQFLHQCKRSFKNTCKPRTHWCSLMVSGMVFAFFCCAGLAMVYLHATTVGNESRTRATDLAKETGIWFSDELEKAMRPLFSLAQFVTEIKLLRDLAAEIGPAGQPGSLPSRPPLQPGGDVSHRDLTNSSCVDPEAVARFNEIAATIKRNAEMPGVLLQLFIDPQAVICMIYPLIVQESNFPEGVYYNATPSLGLDFMTDPKLVYHGLDTLRSNDLVIAGPLVLRQCLGIADCHPVVEKAFVARLPVDTGDTMLHEGNMIPKWGFVAATINWQQLVDNSGMYERFERLGKDFLLERIDRIYGQEDERVVLAESPGFQTATSQKSEVSVPLQTPQNLWEVTVRYNRDEHLGWRKWSVPVIVFVSGCISFLVFTVLVSERKAQKSKLEIERNMTAYFAHELRNPLAAIDCALSAMPDDLPKTATDLHDGMKLSSNLMSSIMNNLLDVRSMEEGKLTLHGNPLALDQLVKEMHQMQSPAVRDGVEFFCKTDGTQGRNWVVGDSYRLKQVFTNVLSNAIKYTTSGSITLSIGWEKNYVRFECADTGPGIPLEKQPELFQRFVRRSGAPGTGLGLAIAKHIVEVMQGSIYFVSDPTVAPGSSCIVLLPLEECETPDADDGDDDSQKKERHRRDPKASVLIEEKLSILIVDDIEINRTMLKRRFEKCVTPNCEITEASTGEESLKICENQTFDVLLVDQYMENAGGVLLGTDTIIAMRRMGQRGLIIGCSGNEMEEEFMEAGANHAWSKPLPPNAEIIRQFRAALNGETSVS